MVRLPKEKAVLCLVDDPTPVAFFNVYEEGDVWVKIKGCNSCPVEARKNCCGNCPMVTPNGDCYWHLEKKNSSKPFYCIIKPAPDQCKRTCALEFQCISGSRKGKIRRVADPGGVFVDA